MIGPLVVFKEVKRKSIGVDTDLPGKREDENKPTGSTRIRVETIDYCRRRDRDEVYQETQSRRRRLTSSRRDRKTRCVRATSSAGD